MSSEQTQFIEFDVANPDLENGRIVEASAGSGKTFSVAGIVAHEIATRPELRISEILVTTFTRNAAAELRDRIRRRLVTLEDALRNNRPADNDELARTLVQGDRIQMADRLVRAIREFDSATIATIHSVCSRVMAMAGLSVVGEGRTNSEIEELIAGVINDEFVSIIEDEASDFLESDSKTFLKLDSKTFLDRLTKVVKASLGSPLSLLVADGQTDQSNDKNSGELSVRTRRVVRSCVDRIRALTKDDPTFDDLLYRTARVLGNGEDGDPAVARAFRERFSLAIIDEAQDTDELQWSIFRSAFGADETTRKLVAVGDPKQAIYRFRGADVEAYIAERDSQKLRSLSRNWRSDADLVTALNVVFDGKSFGNGINYVTTVAREGAPKSSLGPFPAMSILNIGELGNGPAVVEPAAYRVLEILTVARFNTEDKKSIPPNPGDICVLVNSKNIGRKIEATLRNLGVPAVSSGTESVMSGAIAAELKSLFRAMEKMNSESHVRLAAATIFFGFNLVDVGSMSEKDLEIVGNELSSWNGTLRRSGISGLASVIRQNSEILNRLVSGSGGERRETDFVHLIELLHAETKGRGCDVTEILNAFSRLSEFDDLSELVSRRVESDRDAVQIMTVHSSKGLEFPIVVVADLWKMERRGGTAPVPIFHHNVTDEDGEKSRLIDVGWIVGQPHPLGNSIMKSEEGAEKKRLFYVAMTRAEHHVSLIYASRKADDKVERVTDSLLEDVKNSPDKLFIEVRDFTNRLPLDSYNVNVASDADLKVASLSKSLERSYQRQSFSGLTKNSREGSATNVDQPEIAAGGVDDDAQILSIHTGYASSDTPLAPVDCPMPLARLIGGTYFGKVLHRVYELVDFSASDLRSEVRKVVDKVVVGALALEKESLIEGIALSIETPMGGVLNEVSLSEIQPRDRLAELNFEMSVADLSSKVKVSDIGKVLRKALFEAGRTDDILLDYARDLESNFDTPIVGLMNGSIDALLRIPVDGQDQYFIADYKSNRLDVDGDEYVINGYSRVRMMEEMSHHDYPLQALIYGVGVYRYLRWCQPEVDADEQIAGFCYLFIRSMIGPDTPTEGADRHGVFTWIAPPGLWTELSLLFSGVRS